MSEAAGKTILLVEDEVLIALAEGRALEKHGYKVITAFTGEKAVELALADETIDLILMDIDLGGGVDGTVAARRILEGRERPLVFLSSHTEADVVAKTEGITSYGYIVKNSGTTILLASINMAFRLFDARSSLRDREQHYHSLFENSAGPIWIEDFSAFKRRVEELRAAGHADFRAWLSDHPEKLFELVELVSIVDLNGEALRSIGLRSREDMPRKLSAFVGPEASSFLPAELSALAEGQRVFKREITEGRPGSPMKTYLLSLHVIAGHEEDLARVYIVLNDLSGLRQAEDDLAHSRAELRAIYDSSPVMMCVVDRERRVLFANKAFSDFTGVSETELVGGRACGVFGCINSLDDPRGCGHGPECRDCGIRLAIEDTFASGVDHRDIHYDRTLIRDGLRKEISTLASTALINQVGQTRVLLTLYDVSSLLRQAPGA